MIEPKTDFIHVISTVYGETDLILIPTIIITLSHAYYYTFSPCVTWIKHAKMAWVELHHAITIIELIDFFRLFNEIAAYTPFAIIIHHWRNRFNRHPLIRK